LCALSDLHAGSPWFQRKTFHQLTQSSNGGITENILDQVHMSCCRFSIMLFCNF